MATGEKPWRPKDAPQDITLINAHIIDVDNGKIVPNSTVHISRYGLIESISSSSESSDTLTATSSSSSSPTHGHTIIDLHSAYVCPGLIDLHIHLTASPGQPNFSTLFSLDQTTVALRAAYVAKRMLHRGFTTVRDTGGSNTSIRSAIAENLIPGPRLFIAGKALSQTGGHADLRASWQGSQFKCCDSSTPGFGRVCDGVPACLEAARDELRQGANFLKVMCGGGVVSPSDPLEMIQFTPSELQAISSTATSIGTYVTAHAYTDSAVRHAVENGCKGIEHGNFISRSTARWLKDQDVIVTPTLATYKAMSLPEYRSQFSEEAQRKNQQVLASGLESLKTLTEENVTLGFGTDLLSSMHELQNTEFAIRGQVLSPPEVLKQATVNGAKALGMEGKIGVVKAGAWADLLILKENPLEDVSVLANIGENCLGIIKEGRVVMSRVEKLERDEVYGG